MPTLHIELTIDAPRNRVWEALCRNDQWYQWNTFLFDRRPHQTLTLGHSLILGLQRLPKEPETQFQAIITQVEADSCLRWTAIAPGYRSEHTFRLHDAAAAQTHYSHRESVAGVLGPLFFPFIRKDEKRGLRRMARELKDYAETQY